MQPFRDVRGAAAPLLIDDINTDTIAPTRPRAQMAGQKTGERELDPAALFAPLRYRQDGSDDPDFVLNRPGFRAAKIMIAGRNFGSGSSREQAVWLLADFGIRCILAPGFGGIFYDSCFKNGILPVVLPAAQIERLAAEAGDGGPAHQFVVDLAALCVTAPSGYCVKFELPKFRQTALLEGLDDIEMTMRRAPEIQAFSERDRAARPWIWAARRPT